MGISSWRQTARTVGINLFQGAAIAYELIGDQWVQTVLSDPHGRAYDLLASGGIDARWIPLSTTICLQTTPNGTPFVPSEQRKGRNF